jgi:hypothetical protein
MLSVTRKSILSGGLLLAALTFLFAAAPQASAADVYSGNWNNKKYKTKGPLTATLTKGQGNQWTGTFTGTGLGKPFRYNTRFTSKQQGNRLLLTGTSNVDGDTYKWAAYVTGKQLSGSYRSNSGNNGNFGGSKK